MRTRMLRLCGWFVLAGLMLTICQAPCFGQAQSLLTTPAIEWSDGTVVVSPVFESEPAMSVLRANYTPFVDVPSYPTDETQYVANYEVSGETSCDTSCDTSCGMTCDTGCCKTGCGDCGSLCGPKCCCIWARFDVLGWAVQGYSTPALLTSSPAGTAQGSAGILGNPQTTTLFGNRRFGNDLRLGARLQAGYWFDPCRRVGVQGDFFSLGSASNSGEFRSDRSNILARPFFNTDPDVNAQDAQIFAMPGLAEGFVRFDTSSRIVSAGPALRFNLCCCQDQCSNRSRRTDFLLGYRYLGFQEEFAAREVLRPTDGLFVAGTRYELNDRIRTENDFHGVEFGLNHMFHSGRWYWDVGTVLAVGQVRRVAELAGSTRVTVPSIMDTTVPGGFFVGANDIGRVVDNDITAIPQVRANIGYCIANNWRLGVGYNFLYVGSLFRPNSFLNTSIDGSQLAREPVIGTVVDHPTTPPKQSAYIHGLNVFLTYNF